MYSKILLIWLIWDQTGVDCWIFWIISQYLYWPKFLQLIICYCSYTNAMQLTRGMFRLYISFLCWFRVILYVFCIAEEVDGLGDKGLEDNHSSCCTHSLGGLFKHTLEIGLFHWCFFFPGKKQNFWSWNYCPRVLDCQNFGIIGLQRKGFFFLYVELTKWNNVEIF